ncbi:hypothetical protein PY730_27905 (plasmid) [Klebsiella pneumoniae]|nr:hypothetical protein PY730_27905 [Klebsiella pneumoniae]
MMWFTPDGHSLTADDDMENEGYADAALEVLRYTRPIGFGLMTARKSRGILPEEAERLTRLLPF